MRSALKVMAGVAACSVTAIALVSFLQDAGELRIAGLAVCFIAVIATAVLAGRLAATLGSFFAAIVFEVWLYPPFGHVVISEPGGLLSVIVFFFLSLSVAIIAKPAQVRAR